MWEIVYDISKWMMGKARSKTIAIIKPVSPRKIHMSIMLELPPKIEALLRQCAKSTGQNISQMALSVLALGLSLDDNDFFEAFQTHFIVNSYGNATSVTITSSCLIESAFAKLLFG
jgi:hypothetical protein